MTLTNRLFAHTLHLPLQLLLVYNLVVTYIPCLKTRQKSRTDKVLSGVLFWKHCVTQKADKAVLGVHA